MTEERTRWDPTNSYIFSSVNYYYNVLLSGCHFMLENWDMFGLIVSHYKSSLKAYND